MHSFFKKKNPSSSSYPFPKLKFPGLLFCHFPSWLQGLGLWSVHSGFSLLLFPLHIFCSNLGSPKAVGDIYSDTELEPELLLLLWPWFPLLFLALLVPSSSPSGILCPFLNVSSQRYHQLH